MFSPLPFNFWISTKWIFDLLFLQWCNGSGSRGDTRAIKYAHTACVKYERSSGRAHPRVTSGANICTQLAFNLVSNTYTLTHTRSHIHTHTYTLTYTHSHIHAHTYTLKTHIHTLTHPLSSGANVQMYYDLTHARAFIIYLIVFVSCVLINRYSYNVEELPTVARLFDFFLTEHPLAPLYLASVVCKKKKRAHTHTHYIHIYTHAYIHTCIHTHTRTHIHTCRALECVASSQCGIYAWKSHAACTKTTHHFKGGLRHLLMPFMCVLSVRMWIACNDSH